MKIYIRILGYLRPHAVVFVAAVVATVMASKGITSNSVRLRAPP